MNKDNAPKTNGIQQWLQSIILPHIFNIQIQNWYTRTSMKGSWNFGKQISEVKEDKLGVYF